MAGGVNVASGAIPLYINTGGNGKEGEGEEMVGGGRGEGRGGNGLLLTEQEIGIWLLLCTPVPSHPSGSHPYSN